MTLLVGLSVTRQRSVARRAGACDPLYIEALLNLVGLGPEGVRETHTHTQNVCVAKGPRAGNVGSEERRGEG